MFHVPQQELLTESFYLPCVLGRGGEGEAGCPNRERSAPGDGIHESFSKFK